MKNFVLPGLYENFPLNKALIEMKKNHPEYFLNDINIQCFYGNFQYCIWDGGRVFSKYTQTTKEEIEYIIKYYNENNIAARLIYTNPVINETHCQDRFSNLVTSMCNNNLNEIVVNSSILEEYLRKNYPNFKYISSTTKCISKPQDSIKELQKDYFMVCLDYNLNKNKKYLDSIPEDLRKKVEFLCNAICPPGCPNRKEHYRLNGISGIQFGRIYNIKCGITGSTLAKNTFEYRNNLSPEDIEEYHSSGFSYFKLEGRTLSFSENILNYVRYLIKPDYQFECIHDLEILTQKNINELKQIIGYSMDKRMI